ncbi:hypothetical protein HY345_01290 [Candidatus Microgenomates bacterium]|nr:hypothetical protein [Candidatus Microgenomates bacterium]
MKKFLIIFGLPGAGKSYVGEILKNHYHLPLYDGDDELPREMKKALFNKTRVKEKMRRKFFEALMTKIEELLSAKKDFVFMQTFLKDHLRRKIYHQYPFLKFLQIEAEDVLREKRYVSRQDFNLGLSYLRQTCALFEKPTIPVIKIDNNTEGPDNLIKQLNTIFGI